MCGGGAIMPCGGPRANIGGEAFWAPPCGCMGLEGCGGAGRDAGACSFWSLFAVPRTPLELAFLVLSLLHSRPNQLFSSFAGAVF